MKQIDREKFIEFLQRRILNLKSKAPRSSDRLAIQAMAKAQELSDVLVKVRGGSFNADTSNRRNGSPMPRVPHENSEPI